MLDDESAGLAMDSAQVPPSRRFCGRCGLELNATGICESCSRQRPAIKVTGSDHTKVASALGVYAAFLASSLIALILILNGGLGEAIVIAQEIFTSLLVLVWAALSWKAIKPTLRHPSPLWYLPAAAAMGIATYVLATGILQLFAFMFEMPILRYSDDMLKNGYGWGIIVLSVVIQPAIIEELAFRGIILGELRHVLGPFQAILVSAALFSIIHLSVPALPHLFIMGIALGFLRVRTGSLYPGMILHACHNFLCIAEEYYFRNHS